MDISALLASMIEKNASDVFFVAGLPITWASAGQQHRLDGGPLMPQDTQEVVEAIYGLAGRSMAPFLESRNHDDDFSFAVGGVGRFRVNVFRQRGSLGAVIRVIPFALPRPEELGIPDQVMDCASFNKGLVLVTGPAGAGKSTTLACLIDRLNHSRSGHIVTMEDPIEFVHRLSMQVDCDRDTLLVLVNPVGPTCHKGTDTCFGTSNDAGVEFLHYLQEFIIKRHDEMPEGSYTTSLFKKGVNRMAQKVGEEAVETVIEATNGTDDRLIYEASDPIYHLIVLLTSKGHRIEELAEELAKRHKE